MVVGAVHNMTVSWQGSDARALARGVLMIVALQIVGIVAVLVGLVTIGVGIPVKEFSFGNTLILAGTVGMCTGLILLALSVVATELKLVARRLAAGPRPAADPRARAALPAFPGAEAGPTATAEPPIAPPVAPAVWQEPHMQAEPVPPPPPPPPPQKPKRNLLFQSNVRKDRERAAATGAVEPAAGEPGAPPLPPAPPPADEPSPPPPATFEDAWPKADRGRPGDVPPQRRSSRLTAQPAEPKVPAAAAERAAPPPTPPPQAEPAAAVTVLKSGVVDGMAYSLYSDGSIEAQMPEGMMRFASIDELRAHLDQRP